MISAFYTRSAYGTVFTVCELSENMGNLFDTINAKFDQLEWYLLPNEVNKMLPAIINMTQQPTEIRSFGSIACCRETFKKVHFQKVYRKPRIINLI